MNASALLVIDVQNDFTQPSGRLRVDRTQAEEMIANINAILTSPKAGVLLPIYIGNEFHKFDPLNIFRNFASLEGTKGAKLDPRLKVVNNHYFSKRQGDAFSNPALVDFLRNAKIERLYLAGLQAEACVYRTFLGARKRGFSCSVIEDAVASKTEARRPKMIRRLAREGAEIVVTKQLLESDHLLLLLLSAFSARQIQSTQAHQQNQALDVS
jgi:nicotinamidase-related amidase